jgi:hypothetical protein
MAGFDVDNNPFANYFMPYTLQVFVQRFYKLVHKKAPPFPFGDYASILA